MLLTVILFKNGFSFLNKNVFDILGMVETYFILKCLLRPGVVQCNSQLKQHDWIMEYVTYVKFLFTLTNATLCKLHTVKSEFRSWLPYITSIIKLWRKREQRRQRTLLGLVYSVMLISCCDTQFNRIQTTNTNDAWMTTDTKMALFTESSLNPT